MSAKVLKLEHPDAGGHTFNPMLTQCQLIIVVQCEETFVF